MTTQGGPHVLAPVRCGWHGPALQREPQAPDTVEEFRGGPTAMALGSPVSNLNNSRTVRPKADRECVGAESVHRVATAKATASASMLSCAVQSPRAAHPEIH